MPILKHKKLHWYKSHFSFSVEVVYCCFHFPVFTSSIIYYYFSLPFGFYHVMSTNSLILSVFCLFFLYTSLSFTLFIFILLCCHYIPLIPEIKAFRNTYVAFSNTNSVLIEVTHYCAAQWTSSEPIVIYIFCDIHHRECHF